MASSDQRQPPIPADFLAMLACPVCDDRPGLDLAEDGEHLRCSQCQRLYPVRHGIPELTQEAAQLPAD